MVQAEKVITFFEDGTADVTARSILSGDINTLRVKLTPEQYDQWQGGIHIQVALFHLSAEEREFLISGITPAEWEEEFKEPDEVVGREESGE